MNIKKTKEGNNGFKKLTKQTEQNKIAEVEWCCTKEDRKKSAKAQLTFCSIPKDPLP